MASKQRELADRLLTIEQKAQNDAGGDELTSGVNSSSKSTSTPATSKALQGLKIGSIGFRSQNTVIGSDTTTVASLRQPGIVPSGAFQPLTIELTARYQVKHTQTPKQDRATGEQIS